MAVNSPSTYLYGASGHALVIADILRANGGKVAALIDLHPSSVLYHGLQVLAEDETQTLAPYIIAIGDNRRRKQVAEKLEPNNAAPAAVHPSAVVSPSAEIGAGSVVMPGAVVGPEARIGRHAIVNTGATVDHECRIGDYAHIAPGAHLCGSVTVGQGALIGVGASIIPGITVGPWAIVGAGAAVISDIPAGATAVGVPARIKRRQ